METQITTAHCLIAIALFSVVGYNQQSTNPQSTEPHVIAEGIIYSLEYELGDGRTGGFTRTNIAKAVPGGNGVSVHRLLGKGWWRDRRRRGESKVSGQQQRGVQAA